MTFDLLQGWCLFCTLYLFKSRHTNIHRRIMLHDLRNQVQICHQLRGPHYELVFFFLNSWTPLPNGLCLDVQCQAIFGTLQWRGFGGTIVQLLNWPACYLKYLAQNKSWGVELLISSIKMETINSQIFTGCEVLQASNS